MVPSLTAMVGQKSTDLNAHNTQTSHQVGYTYSTMCKYIYIYHIKQIHHNTSHECPHVQTQQVRYLLFRHFLCKLQDLQVHSRHLKTPGSGSNPPIGPGWWGMLPTCRQLCALKYSPRDLLYGNGLKCSPLPYFIYHGSMEWFEMILMLLGNSPSTIGR